MRIQTQASRNLNVKAALMISAFAISAGLIFSDLAGRLLRNRRPGLHLLLAAFLSSIAFAGGTYCGLEFHLASIACACSFGFFFLMRAWFGTRDFTAAYFAASLFSILFPCYLGIYHDVGRIRQRLERDHRHSALLFISPGTKSALPCPAA